VPKVVATLMQTLSSTVISGKIAIPRLRSRTAPGIASASKRKYEISHGFAAACSCGSVFCCKVCRGA
jgi:hypothetical protein